MKKSYQNIFFSLFCFSCFALEKVESSDAPSHLSNAEALFEDLQTVSEINKELNDRLPFFYNYSLIGGYFDMPSARINKSGEMAFSGARAVPVNIWSLSLTPFARMEISANYRVYTGQKVDQLINHVFGEYTDKTANVKFGVYFPEDGLIYLPTVSVGINDFTNSTHMYAPYIVATKEFLKANLELSVGYGIEYFKGWFGGAAWTPFRQLNVPVLNTLTLQVEYDKSDYNRLPTRIIEGRTYKTRFNLGVSTVIGDTFQASVSSLRGNEIAFSGTMRYPIGSSQGFFKKTQNPKYYNEPTDTESLGVRRPEEIFAQELAYAFSDQEIDLYSVYLIKSEKADKKDLWIKVVNNNYREEAELRKRIQFILSHLLPQNINDVIVEVEFDGVVCQQYHYRNIDLKKYLHNLISTTELETLSPLENATKLDKENAKCLFRRRKAIWSFVARPRFQTFFGSSTGKFKYNVGILVSPEGYIADQVYWKLQLGYSIKSTTWEMSDVDPENPSQLPNVRTDTINYYKSNSVSLEEGYLQKSWNIGKGFFSRLSFGYFEPAYGGSAGEVLFYPLKAPVAVGIQAAAVLKRHYQGLGFTKQIRKFDGDVAVYIPFVGYQYFLNVYYYFQPLHLDFEMKIGQFLARDVGVRTQIVRSFASGVRVGAWFTLTNAHDKVNGKTYFDKGISFSVPLDFFLRKSSKKYLGYAVSAWLRDSGAVAETGKVLYTTIREQRD